MKAVEEKSGRLDKAMQMSEQREEGQRAYSEGVAAKANPYPAKSREFWDWTHGWTDRYYDTSMLANTMDSQIWREFGERGGRR